MKYKNIQKLYISTKKSKSFLCTVRKIAFFIYLCSMEIQLSTSEMEVLRKLQRNLAGSSDYVRVIRILMLCMGNFPSFVASCLGLDVPTVYRYRFVFLHGGTDELLGNRYKKVIGSFLPAVSWQPCARNAWIEKGEGLEQPTVSGRDRVNINGSLNAHDVTDVIVHVHDCESVNAKSTKDVYQSTLGRHPETSVIYTF